jgi:adenylate kinase family enzyme
MFPLPGRRISVNGTSGSGKTTLGRHLAEACGYPHLELDSIYHQENWQPLPPGEFRRLVDYATSGDNWVIDGNYSKVKNIVWERCDTVVWLDYPLPVILSRLTRRTVGRVLRRELLWGRNRESLFTHLFTRESLFYWVLTTYRRRRREADELFASPEFRDKKLIRFRSPRECDRWLEHVRAASSHGG